MKLIETIHKRKSEYDDDEFDDFHISVKLTRDDQSQVISEISQGEPEDALFCRDLNGAYSIFDLALSAYLAGKYGEELIFERNEIIEED